MRLYIVRHGETVENRDGIMQGHIHGTLTEEGIKQAKALAKRLAEEKIDVIYSSDLNRALDTTKAIASYHPETPIIKSEKLRERYLGELQGRHSSCWDPNNLPASVETSDDFGQRASKIVEDLVAKHPNQNVLISTHDAIAGRIIKAITGKKPKELCGSLLFNSSLSIFELHPDRSYDLILINSIDHLESKDKCRVLTYN